MTGRTSFTLLATACMLLSRPSVAQFENRASIPVALGPVSLAVGDFSHDGKPDLAEVSYLANNQVAVLLGNGDGTFQPPVNYRVGKQPYSVAIADFNHDGGLDLAVANNLGHGISILLGNGDGTFQPSMNFTTPENPTFVSVGDFNGDGIPDLVAVDYPKLSVLLGRGDGTFHASIDTTPPSPVNAIGAGDFNADGKLDLVTSGQFGGSSELGVLLGNGDGTFQVGASYPLEPGPSAVAVADFNRDGKPDLAVADVQGIGVSLFLGKGDGTFQAAGIYPIVFAGTVVAGDFNGDGIPDLAAGGGLSSGIVTVFSGNGDGTFQTGVSYSVGKVSSFLAVGDLNLDHQTDLAVTDVLESTVSILLNTGVVSLSPIMPVEFATQLVGTNSTAQRVALTNTGSSPLLISHFSVTGDFAANSDCKTKVASGASCTFNVVFRPRTIGARTGILSISDSASSKAQVIALSGTGTVVKLSPSKLVFPPQKVSSKSDPMTVTLTNTGGKTLILGSVSITGANVSDFTQINGCGTLLEPAESCTITVQFAPTRTGSRAAEVSAVDDGGGSPQTVLLRGTGT